MILGAPVHDRTPDGRLELQKKAVQIVRDITRRTSLPMVASILRGVLIDRPQFQRVGVISHRPQLNSIKSLEPELSSRIVKTAYFGSGEERSSNDWHTQCDLIIVAGTPRVPPAAVATYLLQVGEVGAACRDPKWGPIRWDGTTESGEPITVKSVGYHDDAWRHAHRDLVRAALVQAIGRGRCILETGCEVLVLSSEECGLVISDTGMERLNGMSTRILDRLRELTMDSSKISYLPKTIVSTVELAQHVGLSAVRTREILRALERRGFVRKVGKRSGWLPVDRGPKPIEPVAPARSMDAPPVDRLTDCDQPRRSGGPPSTVDGPGRRRKDRRPKRNKQSRTAPRISESLGPTTGHPAESNPTGGVTVPLIYPPPGSTIYFIVGSSRVDLQACKLEYSIVSPK